MLSLIYAFKSDAAFLYSSGVPWPCHTTNTSGINHTAADEAKKCRQAEGVTHIMHSN